MSSTDNKQRVTLFINPDLLTHARAEAVVERSTLTLLVEKALIKYLPKETVIKKIDGGEYYMAEIVEQSVTTENQGPKAAVTTETKRVATGTQTIEYLIYFFLGVLEVLLAFRLVLKLTGASLASAFVKIIYSLTGIFIMPF